MRRFCFVLFVVKAMLAAAAVVDTNQFLPAIPEGYYLQAYDDCGVNGRQPHVLMKDCYSWTFNTSDTDAGLKERSAVFSDKGIQAVYTNLDSKLTYVLALTYASDHVYQRVQSLEANGIVLHGPYALPKAKATRVIVKVPSEVTHDGKMTLTWRLHGEANVTVSIIELWADKPVASSLQFGSLAGLPNTLQGQLVDLAFDSVPKAQVSLSVPGKSDVLTASTGPGGVFSFSRKQIEALAAGAEVGLSARQGQREGSTSLNTAELFFKPVHYRPLPSRTAGLARNSILLDGTWLLNAKPDGNMRERALTEPDWAPFKVPGQWLQQGFDVPQEQPVALAKEFTIPEEWAGNRIVLRFDAIHAGATCWLNGRTLGYSENLFTPVEWDITEAVRIGQTNRLDMQAKVATISEKLSFSSGYAFHNLGGIDRSVRLFALPPTHIRQLRLNARLDNDYQDGDL